MGLINSAEAQERFGITRQNLYYLRKGSRKQAPRLAKSEWCWIDGVTFYDASALEREVQNFRNKLNIGN